MKCLVSILLFVLSLLPALLWAQPAPGVLPYTYWSETLRRKGGLDSSELIEETDTGRYVTPIDASNRSSYFQIQRTQTKRSFVDVNSYVIHQDVDLTFWKAGSTVINFGEAFRAILSKRLPTSLRSFNMQVNGASQSPPSNTYREPNVIPSIHSSSPDFWRNAYLRHYHGGGRLIFYGSWYPMWANRQTHQSQLQPGFYRPGTDRDALERAFFTVRSFEAGVGLRWHARHMLSLGLLHLRQGFRSTRSLDWATGLPSDDNTAHTYTFTSYGLSASYRYANQAGSWGGSGFNLTGSLGTYYLWKYTPSEGISNTRSDAFGFRAGLGVKWNDWRCPGFQLIAEPTLFYNATRIQAAEIDTRLLNYGLCLGMILTVNSFRNVIEVYR